MSLIHFCLLANVKGLEEKKEKTNKLDQFLLLDFQDLLGEINSFFPCTVL